ncbi:hypothetical protein D3OALGB2SA_1890 [Olavius algarvensis associated proteobacterium Delta 3]|nr:hypothetical protein D3OALGB2SA_1890 [Olavius algarvensis associated proteobacterium Delta 3]
MYLRVTGKPASGQTLRLASLAQDKRANGLTGYWMLDTGC